MKCLCGLYYELYNVFFTIVIALCTFLYYIYIHPILSIIFVVLYVILAEVAHRIAKKYDRNIDA